MTNRIRAKQIKDNINLDEENIIMKKYPGATTDEIAYYSRYQIDVVKPSRLVLFAGTNDIGYSSREGVPDERKIVDNLINIGVYAKERGTTEVFISSIIHRRGYHYKNSINRVNNLLYLRCLEEGFLYLDHSYISGEHLQFDGLHLNDQGTRILKLNILKCFYTFNPFLADFYVSVTEGLSSVY